MMKIISKLIIGLLCLSWSVSMSASDQGPMITLAKIKGPNFKCILVATKELDQKKIDIEKYDVSIVEDSESIVLILKAPDAQDWDRGNLGKIPGYEVEVRKKDHHVMRSNFIR